jgi:hypothetical protein
MCRLRHSDKVCAQAAPTLCALFARPEPHVALCDAVFARGFFTFNRVSLTIESAPAVNQSFKVIPIVIGDRRFVSI